MELITKTLAPQEILQIQQFKKSLSKQEWQNSWFKSYSFCTNLSSKYKATMNHQKIEQSETKSQKYSSALTDFSKKLLLEIRTIEFTSRVGLIFSLNIPIKLTDLTSKNVWSASYRTIHFQLKPQSTKTKLINLSTLSLSKPEDKLFWQLNIWDFSQLSSNVKTESLKKIKKLFLTAFLKTLTIFGVLSLSFKRKRKNKFKILCNYQQIIQFLIRFLNTK